MLLATAACNFSTSELPRVLRSWCVLHVLNCKCASRHSGVCNFSCLPLTWLRTRRFSEPTFFDPAKPQIIGKTQRLATSLTFRACGSWIFFLLTFPLLYLLSSDSTSGLSLSSSYSASLLCFSTIHIVGS